MSEYTLPGCPEGRSEEWTAGFERRRMKLEAIVNELAEDRFTFPEWALKDWERIIGKPYDPPPPCPKEPSEEWKARDAEWRMARDAERMAQEALDGENTGIAEDDSDIICDWEDEGPGEEDEEAPLSFDLKSILARLEAVVAAHAARTDDAAAFTEAAKKDLLLLKKHRKLEFRRMVAKLRTTKCDVPGLLKALKAAGMRADTTSRANSNCRTTSITSVGGIASISRTAKRTPAPVSIKYSPGLSSLKTRRGRRSIIWPRPEVQKT